MPPPPNTPSATLATMSAGAVAKLRVTTASGMPTSRPAAAKRPTVSQSSSAVSPRTMTGWRFKRFGRKATVVSRLASGPGAPRRRSEDRGGISEKPNADDEEDGADRDREPKLAPGLPSRVDLGIHVVGVIADADEHARDHEERHQHHDVVTVVLQRLQDPGPVSPRGGLQDRKAGSLRFGVDIRGEENRNRREHSKEGTMRNRWGLHGRCTRYQERRK